MTAKREEVGRGFWLRWVLANAVGVALGWGLWDLFSGAFMSEGGNFLAIFLARIFTGRAAETAVFASHWAGYIVGGAVIALAQWTVLRYKVQPAAWVSLPITLAPTLILLPLAVLLMVLIQAAVGRGTSLDPDAAFVAEFVVVVFGSLLLGLAAAGVARWVVVKRSIGRAGWGVLASSVAFSVGFIIGYAFGPEGTLVVPVAMVGVVNGIFQRLALRGQMNRAGWWVPANALGLALGGGAGAAWLTLLSSMFGMSIYGAVSPLTMASFGAVAGAVGGAITGGVLVRLLRNPIHKTTEGAVAARA